MTLRRRISVAAAAAAAVAMLVAVLVCYAILSAELRDQVDSQLRAQAQVIVDSQLEANLGVPTASPKNGGAAQLTQVVFAHPLQGVELGLTSAAGVASSTEGGGLTSGQVLPNVAQARRIARSGSGQLMETIDVKGMPVRVYIFSASVGENGDPGAPVAVELARPLSSVYDVLAKMRVILAVLLILGIALATLLGRFASRRVLAPITEVTETAQLIGETDDLSRRIHVTQEDEVGQMAARFNEMLERLSASRSALDASVTAQRQLVADASHELRTPVTSLRTNIEVLLEDAVIDEEDRKRLLTDVVEQSEELTSLVADLIEVARGDLPEESIEDTRLDLLVDEALARARRHNPGIEFTAELTPVAVQGHPERLTRAINNLLDNAAKHNAPGRPVEVTVTPSALAVRDHGGGIDPADLPYVFDRFYRGINSRSRQGSGLGLAIVKQVAEQHDGSVVAANAATGGAIFTLRIPGVKVEDDYADEDDYLPYVDGDSGTRGSSAVSDDPIVPGDLKTPTQ
jgi:two-component system, OmpR family, sensor histidine kinase MprB